MNRISTLQYLIEDASGKPVQGFLSDPTKAQVPINLNGTKTFVRGSGGDYDITDWIGIRIVPSTTNITRYFNGNNTKTATVFAGQENIILFHPGVTSMSITGIDASVEIEGM